MTLITVGDNFLKKLLSPIIIIIFINLIIGLYVAGDFGESWDESPMRYYADISLKAYDNFFQPGRMQTYYGDEIMRYYGPAYVMFSKLVVAFVSSVTNLEINTVYHFINFLIFILGIYFFYSINIKMFPKPVAVGNTLLFNLQPLLWGHGFINPKDLPFMVFFLGTVATGLNLSFNTPKSTVNLNKIVSFFSTINTSNNEDMVFAKKQFLKSGIYSCLTLIILISIYLSGLSKTIITNILVYANDYPKSFLGRVFDYLAINNNQISLGNYINKSVIILNTFWICIIVLIIIVPPIQYFFVSRKTELAKTLSKIKLKVVDDIEIFSRFFSNPKNWKTALSSSWSSFRNILADYRFWFAAIMLGICSATRTIGLYAGFLVAILLFSRNWKRAIPILFLYIIFSFFIMYFLWPYLWGAPFSRLNEAVSVMSNFPWDERILFNGNFYKVDRLPNIYLPELLLLQFTEPTVLLSIAGFFIILFKTFTKKINYIFFLLLFWLFIPVLASIIFHTPIYDNFRHILFVIPPIFIISGFALEFIFYKFKHVVFYFALVLVLLPGLIKIIELHPYQYVYYNSAVNIFGGVSGNFELDYFGTSVKESVEFLNANAPKGSTILINAPFHLATSEARSDLILKESPGNSEEMVFNYSINLNRFYWGAKVFPIEKEIFRVNRGGATFISVRQITN